MEGERVRDGGLARPRPAPVRAGELNVGRSSLSDRGGRGQDRYADESEAAFLVGPIQLFLPAPRILLREALANDEGRDGLGRQQGIGILV